MARRTSTPAPSARDALADYYRSTMDKWQTHYAGTRGADLMDDWFLRRIEKLDNGGPVVVQTWELPRKLRPSWLRWQDNSVCLEADGSFSPLERWHPSEFEVRFRRLNGTEVR